jgi:hypothetical protein
MMLRIWGVMPSVKIISAALLFMSVSHAFAQSDDELAQAAKVCETRVHPSDKPDAEGNHVAWEPGFEGCEVVVEERFNRYIAAWKAEKAKEDAPEIAIVNKAARELKGEKP